MTGKTAVVAVIMECNPPHRGHTYILEQARMRTGASHVIVLMSGNYVQRGEPAIIDKYARAKALLESGADLILELPTYIATGAADYFSRGAVQILDRLGVVTHLCFGSESGEIRPILDIAGILAAEPQVYRDTLRDALKNGASFPSARADAVNAALKTNDAPASKVLSDSSPNDLLATEYCKTLLQLQSRITPVAVKRIETASAGDIRAALKEGCKIPDETAPAITKLLEDALGERAPAGTKIFSQALFYRLHTCGDLTRYADVSDSLSAKISAALGESRDWDDLSMRLKSRDITYTHIRRALLHIFLGITKRDIALLEKAGLVGYVRILGLRSDAKDLLAAIGRSTRIPLVVRPAADGKLLAPPFSDAFERDLRVAELYDLLCRQYYGDDAPSTPEASRPLIIVPEP